VLQHTISEEISCTGIGLHTGQPVELKLRPARENTGIVFIREGRGHPVEIPARPEYVTSTRLATTLGFGEATVGTVEHLLSAFYALGVDNAYVSIDGPEIPVMDGSSASFVFLIRSAGRRQQGQKRSKIRIKHEISVRDGARSISVRPGEGLLVDYAIEYGHPTIGTQKIDGFVVTPESFEKEICRARTFGFLHEVEALWKLGLAKGGTLENTVVLDKERVLNGGGLRWTDEFVRHKVLDLLGDLALLGAPIEGHVSVSRGGHALHRMLLEELMAAPDSWELTGGAQTSRECEIGEVVPSRDLPAPV